jgi:uroporphyrinogen decarboxylase
LAVTGPDPGARARVLAAIDHVQPDVVPLSLMGFDPVEPWLDRFGVADGFELRDRLGLDTQFARPVYTGPNAARGLDIWGRSAQVYGATGGGYGSTREEYPLVRLESVAELDRFPWPDAADFDCGAPAELLASVSPSVARVVRLTYSIGRPGEPGVEAAKRTFAGLPLLDTLFDLLGMEETMVRLHTQPAFIEAAIAHLGHFLLDLERKLLEATHGQADIFHFEDDFASQRGLLISPEHWRRFLRPTYEKIYALARSCGLKVEIHCCGTFRPVLPDMIDMGMDIWEPVQAHLEGNDPSELKREFGRELTFSGGVSTQGVLPHGSPAQVREAVSDAIRAFGRGGGYICGPDHTVLADVPADNLVALIDTARAHRF